jgi:hypothetical protein
VRHSTAAIASTPRKNKTRTLPIREWERSNVSTRRDHSDNRDRYSCAGSTLISSHRKLKNACWIGDLNPATRQEQKTKGVVAFTIEFLGISSVGPTLSLSLGHWASMLLDKFGDPVFNVPVLMSQHLALGSATTRIVTETLI